MTFHEPFSLYGQKGERKYLNRQEKIKFFQGTKDLPFEKMLFCQMLFFTGARISEVAELSVQQIDFNDKVVILRTLKRRKRNIYRQIPIPDHLLNKLLLFVNQTRNVKTKEKKSSGRSHHEPD